MILGEMRGQLREVVHSMNNLSAKFDGLTREVVGLGVLAADLLDIKARVKVLEETKSRHDGASNVISAIMRSPTLGWLVGAAITAWAILTGKVNI
jgi:hypothetical protein